MWCNGTAPIPYFQGDIVIDLDDPKMTPEEVAVLNSSLVRSVVVTTGMMKEALKKLKYRKEIIVIPSGVDKKRLEMPAFMAEDPPEENVKILGYVSTRIKKEELNTLVEILDGISQNGQQAQLWLVGNIEGPRLSRSDVRYFGYVPHQDILPIIKCFDLSLYIRGEDYGGRLSIKMIESFACGVPVVSVESSEAFLITESGAGLVCPRKDLIQVSLTLLKDNPRRKEMSEKGKLFSKDYHWDKIAEDYWQKVWEPLLGSLN
jgi:glycosyltransferase involved in cell wall biosynthesis